MVEADRMDMNTAVTTSPEPHANLWTTADVARFLGCSERHIYALRLQGLPCVRLGGLVRFERAAVENWVRGSSDGADPQRRQQLEDICQHADTDNAECAAADLTREFPNRT